MTRASLSLVVLLLGSFSGIANALDCQNAIVTIEVNECASIEQKQTEAKLNAVYQRVIKGLERPDNEVEKYSEMKTTLVAAQREWVKYREADCQAVYVRHQSGTIRGLMYITCMQARAETRIKELELYEQE